MPGYNRKGPAGEGPMTGRGEGYCKPGTQQSEPNAGEQPIYGLGRGGLPRGGGRGFGFGGGRGIRRQEVAGYDPSMASAKYEPQPTPAQENRLDRVIGALEKIVDRLTEKK